MGEGLRERKKERTRKLIAAKARELFAERGFEGVTVAEVAEAAEVSVQTVFNHFPTKEDLFYSRLESFEDELLGSIRDRPEGETPLAAFRRFLLRERGEGGSPPRSSREADRQLKSASHTILGSPALLAREREVLERYTASLAELLASETDAEADDPRPWLLASSLLGIHKGLIDIFRRGAVEGTSYTALRRRMTGYVDAAFEALERGFGDYDVR